MPERPGRLKVLLTLLVQTAEQFASEIDGGPMEILATAALAYLAIGAAFFAHPASPALPEDFDWRNQINVFRVTLGDVLAWPVALWRFGKDCLGED